MWYVFTAALTAAFTLAITALYLEGRDRRKADRESALLKALDGRDRQIYQLQYEKRVIGAELRKVEQEMTLMIDEDLRRQCAMIETQQAYAAVGPLSA
jgi:hypothetical protein